MQIRVAGFEQESIVDGEGIRFVVFVQGCPHHCIGCHNQDSHDFSKGTVYDTSDIIKMIAENPIITGVTLSGGEPFCQAISCLEIAKQVHLMNKTVWCYSGYTFDEVKEIPLTQEIDVLVDGKFEQDLKSLTLLFRGSSNQRLINVPTSLQQNKVIEKGGELDGSRTF